VGRRSRRDALTPREREVLELIAQLPASPGLHRRVAAVRAHLRTA
jgi:hypothetical protein